MKYGTIWILTEDEGKLFPFRYRTYPETYLKDCLGFMEEGETVITNLSENPVTWLTEGIDPYSVNLTREVIPCKQLFV